MCKQRTGNAHVTIEHLPGRAADDIHHPGTHVHVSSAYSAFCMGFSCAEEDRLTIVVWTDEGPGDGDDAGCAEGHNVASQHDVVLHRSSRPLDSAACVCIHIEACLALLVEVM